MRLALALVLGLAEAALGRTPAAPPDSTKAELGRRVFAAHCASCHGADARGSASFAKGVGAYEPAGLDLTSERLLSLSDEQLAERIRNGHGKMKGFDVRLSSTDEDQLVAYLRRIGRARAASPRPSGARPGS